MRLLLIALILVPACGGCFAQTPDEKAWLTLDHGVHDGNPLKRRQAVLAASLLRPQPRPVAMIETGLADKDGIVREATCATLGEIKSETSIPKLRIAMTDAVPEVIFAAARALYGMNDPAGRAVITAILTGEQSDSSGFIQGSIRDAKLKLHDPRALLLIGINQGAGFAGPFGMAVPLTEGLLKDNQASGKTVAALLLATDRTPESRDALRKALADKNWTVRAAAARAVGTRDQTDLYDDVAPLLDDKRDEVKYSAASALIRLREQPSPPARAPVAAKKKTTR